MAGLVPAIHVPRPGRHRGTSRMRLDVDARDTPGHDARFFAGGRQSQFFFLRRSSTNLFSSMICT